MPVDTALIEAVLVPVPGDAPAGTDLRYDPRYEQVKEARREDLVLPEGGLATDRKVADYNVALKLSRALLEKETKDLQLAGWLAEALLKREGLIGLATGLHVVGGLLDTFWDGCFPSWDENDPELRAGPLEWIGGKFDLPARMVAIAPPGVTFLDYQVSRTVPTETEAESNLEKKELRETALSEGKPAPEIVDRAIADANKSFYKVVVADVTAASAALAQLEKIADARFGRDAPSFLRLRNALDEIKRTAAATLAQKLIDDPDPIVEEAIADAAPVDESGPQSPEPVNAADAARRIAVSSAFLRKLDPTAPGPYLALRGLRFGELRAAAASGELNPRALEAPATAIRSRLKGLLLDGKWPELLEMCEVVMATPPARGWLDLQRYALTACENLGGGYEAVGSAIRDDVRVLIKAIPQLPEMTLMDDTPTANAETKAWLAKERLIGDDATLAAESNAASSAVETSDDEAVLQTALTQENSTVRHGGLAAAKRRRSGPDPYDQAKAEASQGRTRNAIEVLLAEVAREQSARGRFLRQTQLAFIMVESGLDSVARPILEKLVQTIDERKLEEWESGPLVAQPMALLCRIMDRDGEGSSGERRALYLRVCGLDAMQAMALNNS